MDRLRRRFTPLRKRFAFAAGNDAEKFSTNSPLSSPGLTGGYEAGFSRRNAPEVCTSHQAEDARVNDNGAMLNLALPSVSA
jgi:hypothetical protein